MGLGTIAIPPPGTELTLYVDAVNGSATYSISVDESGTVDYQSGAASSDGGDTYVPDETWVSGDSRMGEPNYKPSVTQGCNLTAGGADNKWLTTWQFYRGDGARPVIYSSDSSGATQTETMSPQAWGNVMNRAANNIVNPDSPCDNLDQISATFNNAGWNNREGDMQSDGDCYAESNMDAVSTVEYKALPSSILGLTCIGNNDAAGPDTLFQADVRINKDKRWTLTPGDSHCASNYHAYDLESALTHEFGHAFGLRDVDKNIVNGPNLYSTMYWQGSQCTKYPRTLAANDLYWLRTIY